MKDQRPYWLFPEEWENSKLSDIDTEFSEVGVYTHKWALVITWFTRWTDEWEIDCSHCGNTDEHYEIEGLVLIEEFDLTWRYKCKKCLKKFSVTSGTYLANQKLPIEYWWRTAYLLGSFNIEINSNWLSKDLCVTQTTAYYMLIVIAKALGLKQTTPLKTEKGTYDIMEALLTVRKLNK